MIWSRSWYYNCDIKSICKFLLIVKNPFSLDITGCTIVYAAPAVTELFMRCLNLFTVHAV
jgi:hypothetical protein